MLNKKGVTIILTTHYLIEAEEMCNRIAIINKGNLVALDSTKNLIGRIKHKKIKFRLDKNIKIAENEFKYIKIISNNDKELNLSYDKDKMNIYEIINYINSKNVKILDMLTDDGDLEDVFVDIIKN